MGFQRYPDNCAEEIRARVSFRVRGKFSSGAIVLEPFSINPLDLMCSYLKNQRQSAQVNNDFISAIKVHADVPQSSINEPLLFSLLINGSVIFLTDTSLSNYADDNNLYSIGKDCDIIKNLLRKDFRALIEWFF